MTRPDRSINLDDLEMHGSLRCEAVRVAPFEIAALARVVRAAEMYRRLVTPYAHEAASQAGEVLDAALAPFRKET